MMPNIDIHSSVAVYMQIENHVQFAVSAGRLKAGDQLPSLLDLAGRLNVNPNTVAKAYHELELLGVLHTRHGMGVYINKGAEASCRASCRRRFVERAHEAVGEAKAAGITSAEVCSIVAKSLTYEVNPYSPTPPDLFSSGKARPNAT